MHKSWTRLPTSLEPEEVQKHTHPHMTDDGIWHTSWTYLATFIQTGPEGRRQQNLAQIPDASGNFFQTGPEEVPKHTYLLQTTTMATESAPNCGRINVLHRSKYSPKVADTNPLLPPGSVTRQIWRREFGFSQAHAISFRLKLLKLRPNKTGSNTHREWKNLTACSTRSTMVRSFGSVVRFRRRRQVSWCVRFGILIILCLFYFWVKMLKY